ncbi:hypothetical protein ZIOFF_064794 [Zingiber officinale]|uniref:Kinesin motor domain-containing protein n=2 Tax=Zingiber officinale TaxID=94328 RepID=A0A8J5EXM9_ZINOF|nr:hypothetical protein ZIOFF_064794 [Zingiber officinale]
MQLLFYYRCHLLLLLWLAWPPQWATGCHPTDRAALRCFRAGIAGDPSGLLRTWDAASADCCTAWAGVACDDSTGRVVNLTLPGFSSSALDFASLTGTLSQSLGALSALRVLDLSNLKQLTGRIPPSLARLSRLEVLLLDSNDLSGGIPSGFANLTRLRRVCLSSNKLSGPIPAFASPVLSVLSLAYNRLTGSIPASIGQSTELRAVDLHDNNLTGSIPIQIGSLRKLTFLDLSENQISGSIPSSIDQLKTVSVLYLNHNRLTGTIPSTIGGMLSLQFCRISENRLTGRIPESIGDLPNIERLILENNQLTGELPAAMGRLSFLTHVFLANNRITGRIPSSVGGLGRLLTLELSRNRLHGPIPRELSQLRNLQNLDLSFNPLGNPPRWFGDMGLFKISLAGTGISGPLPEWLSSSTSISILDLSSNRVCGEIPRWIGNMTSLSFLNLSRNALRGRIPEEFKNLTTLMDLDLHGNAIGGRIRPVMAKGTRDPLGHYRTVDLSGNRFTGGLDPDVGELPAMDAVERLVLSNNPGLGGGIPASMARMASLREVEMAGDGLAGRIPEGVLDLEKLEVFDVSHNGLIGQIPNHRSPVAAKGFRGNPELCGAPLPPCKPVRPLNAKEIERNDPSDWECINNNTVALKNNNLPDRSACPTVYTFDRVFGFKCSTKDVYEEGAKEVALSVVSGINATIFAYGQTSSGKTHTMIGITELSVADIYAYIKRHEEREFLLKFSAMEIYNEAVRDLLSADASSLRLLDDPERGTIVEKLTEETLRDESHLKELLSICEAQRQIGETSLNETSSRSHQILRLTIESSTREFVSRNSTLAATVYVSLEQNFVDLAGSERASQSLSAGARLKEGCHINRSLLTLGTVIRKLSEGRNGHIPYRDSKLTRILQSSLGGNARTAIICTMSPARSHVEQSRNTLFFANRAKQVVTNAQVNVVMSDKALIKHLQREVARLESELSSHYILTMFLIQMEREIKELMQQRDLAQSRLDDLSTTLGDDEQSSRQWDELSQSSGVAFQSPDFYSRRFSGTSDVAYQCQDIAESRRFYAASDIAYRSPDIGLRRLCMPRESKYGGEYHLELCGKLDKDQYISSPSHSVISSAISGLILQQRSGKSYESLQEHIADHCKEVRCIEIHALSTSKSEDSSAASVIQDDDSLPSQGGVSMDLIPRMENPSNSSSSLPKTPRVMTSRELAQTRSSNSETRPMIVSPFPSDDVEQHHEKQPDALWEEFPVSPEESHKSSELSSIAVQTGDILIVAEDDNAHIGSCSPGMVQSWLQKKLLDSQENQHKQAEDSEVEKIVKDVGIDSVLYPVESPSRWPFDFERKQQEIIELWHSCHVSLVHRTYFFLLFKGDPTDSIYMEVEHRRLSFLRNTSSHVHCDTTIATENSHIPTSSSLKHLRREREMLCRQMQRRLTLQERIMSYNKWGINLNSKQRRLQLGQLVWTKTETAHAGESASLVGKLIGLEEQGQALKEMFGLSFLPQQTNHRHFIWMKNKKSPSLA